jgi:hypothetical protein
MSPVTFVGFTLLVFLAVIGGIAGILIESERKDERPAGCNPAVRDALFPVAGWAAFFALYGFVIAIGGDQMPIAFKHLLGTLAVLVFYYAVLATVVLILVSVRRMTLRLLYPDRPVRPLSIPLFDRFAWPTLFLSAFLAAISVFLYDGFSQNFAFIACLLALTAIVRKRRLVTTAAKATLSA